MFLISLLFSLFWVPITANSSTASTSNASTISTVLSNSSSFLSFLSSQSTSSSSLSSASTSMSASSSSAPYVPLFPLGCLDLEAQSCSKCAEAHNEIVSRNDSSLGCFWCDGRIRACLPYYLPSVQIRLDQYICPAPLTDPDNPYLPGLNGTVHYQTCPLDNNYVTCQDRHCDCHNCTLDPQCAWCSGYDLCMDVIPATDFACSFLQGQLSNECVDCPPLVGANNTSDSAQCIGNNISLLTCPGLTGATFPGGCLDLNAQTCEKCALAHEEALVQNSSTRGCFWCDGRIRACLPYYLASVRLTLDNYVCNATLADSSIIPGLNGIVYNQTCDAPERFFTCQNRHCDCLNCTRDPACLWCPDVNICFDAIPAAPVACSFLGSQGTPTCDLCPAAPPSCNASSTAGLVTCPYFPQPPATSGTNNAPSSPSSPVPSSSNTKPNACLKPGNRCDDGYLCVREECIEATSLFTTSSIRLSGLLALLGITL